jgi:hypothetical protein
MLVTPDVSDVELKQRWRIYWLQTVFEFSSRRLQRMSWMEGESADWPDGEVWPSSFERSQEAYFDDLALDDNYEKAIQWGNVTQEEADHAQSFHQLLVFYDEPSDDPETIIADPEWLEVVEAAQAFWNYLKTTVTSQREINLMQKLEKDFS